MVLDWNTPLLLMSTHTIKVSLLMSLLNRQRVGKITSCSDATNCETLAIEAAMQSCSIAQKETRRTVSASPTLSLTSAWQIYL